ncbi:DUF4133 domain-containing protein [Chitinophaga oryzae]|uniref:DUF4133 domain-containing protein n=1 Tax=Chitinophaga oryzae TaxID=2725414 RepID=A0AAE7DA39_9BACT|nr:DUF4133 domain-containing protein [Chitinophaga oryzae]QJB34907.1 DUF4133 domain-containing protein [Chitinophaga oryzae]QJB41418.1 DUF4133 domain-containing protein [Chitinophaga oryzae]
MIRYPINKGVNRPIEFRGLKGQYIYIMAVGLAVLLIIFSILYIAGVPNALLLPVVGIAGFGLLSAIFRLSHRYGVYGLMKAIARRGVPSAIYCNTKKTFTQLLQHNNCTTKD